MNIWKYIVIAVMLFALSQIAAPVLVPLFVPVVAGLVISWAVLYLCIAIIKWMIK